MMRDRLIAVRERRARLVARAQDERERLGRVLDRSDAAFAWIDRLRGAIAQLRRRPLEVAAALLLVFALRPRRTLQLAASGLWLWRLWRRARRLAAGFLDAAERGRGSAA